MDPNGYAHSMQNLHGGSYRDPYRDAAPSPNPENQNYFDGNVPPPHRLSAIHDSPYPLTYPSSSHLPEAGPSYPYKPADASARGAYAAAPMTSYGADDAAARTSQARLYDHIDNSDAYYNRWPTNPPPKSSRKKWIICGVVTLLVVTIVAVAAGVAVSKSHSSGSSSNRAKSGSSGSSTGAVNQTDPNDPSTFEKDPRLIQSFWGMAYTPEGSQLPNCGNNLSSVIEDIQLMSQLTTRVRLYGADCNQSALVLEAIKRTKVNMTVWLAIYNLPSDNHVAYQRQRDEVKAAIQTYGVDHVGGVTVGNEFILDYVTANGGVGPNSDVANTGAAVLIADIADMRSTLAGLNLPKTVQVGNSEAGSYFNTLVLQQSDYGMSNVHPWFANTTIGDAASWTADFFATTNVQPAALLSNKPTMWIAETGWPTNTSNPYEDIGRPDGASEPNMQIFLNNFLCQANANGTGYFFFDFFDEPWKDVQFGGVEGFWGLFYHNKTLKDITIPNCPL